MIRKKETVLTLIGQIDHLLKALEATVEEARLKANEFKELEPSSFDLRGMDHPGAAHHPSTGGEWNAWRMN